MRKKSLDGTRPAREGHERIPSAPERIPRYRRQRLLLLLFESSGSRLRKADLQMLLYIACNEGGVGHYDFVLLQDGPHSFQAEADLRTLERQGWIKSDGGSYSLRNRLPVTEGVDSCEREEIKRITGRSAAWRGDALERYAKVEQAVRVRARTANGAILYTIGYEGSSFDAYVTRLLRAGVSLLCDVRRNAWSRKFGFSRGMLAELLPRVGISYLHVPTLGIDSDRRRSLKTKADYGRLFAEYRGSLPRRKSALERVSALLRQHQRVALTCFEKDPCSCHRHCVSDYLARVHQVRAEHL